MSTLIDTVQAWLDKKKPIPPEQVLQFRRDLNAYIEGLIYKGADNPFTSTAYMNFRETHGKNRSPDIDAMITRNRGQLGDPYCVFGIQDILRCVEKRFNCVVDLPKTGGVLKLWQNTKDEYKTKTPKAFTIACYQQGATLFGHAMFSFGPVNDKEFSSFEFNTSPNADNEIIRDGEGCYFKLRRTEGFGNFKPLGFIDILEAIKR
jgi:hypothetical protein